MAPPTPAKPPAGTAPADPWWYEDPEAFEGFMAKFKAHPNAAGLFPNEPPAPTTTATTDVGEHASLTDLLGAVLRDGIVHRANGGAAPASLPPGAPVVPTPPENIEQPLTWQEKLWGRQKPPPTP